MNAQINNTTHSKITTLLKIAFMMLPCNPFWAFLDDNFPIFENSTLISENIDNDCNTEVNEDICQDVDECQMNNGDCRHIDLSSNHAPKITDIYLHPHL